MRLDVPHIHGQQADAAGAEYRRRFDFVMLDIGWHVGSPWKSGSTVNFNPEPTYRVRPTPIINSFERTRNEITIFACVALL
jgi:hypothetical protein